MQVGVFPDQAADRIGREAEAHLGGGVVERGLGDHLAEDALGNAELHRLLRREVLADLLAELPHGHVEAAAELGAGEMDVADLGDVVGAIAPEDIGHAPDTEADHQEQHHDLDDPTGRHFA